MTRASGREVASGPRRRDAEATKAALLSAASEQFAAHGYSATTLRDVAGAAGVDVALVSRYFGGKRGLHRAVLANDVVAASAPTADVPLEQMVDRLFRMWDESGVGSGLPAFVVPGLEPAVRAEALRLTQDRLLKPLTERLHRQGVAEAAFRAELVVATLVGIGLARAVGSLGALTAAPRDQVLDALAEPLLQLAGLSDGYVNNG